MDHQDFRPVAVGNLAAAGFSNKNALSPCLFSSQLLRAKQGFSHLHRSGRLVEN
jgi:hypothetical protein